jgi:hypothetical protein
MDVGGRNNTPVMLTLRTRVDALLYNGFVTRARLRIVLVMTTGAGVNQTWIIVDLPNAALAKCPKPSPLDDRLGQEVVLEGIPDIGPAGAFAALSNASANDSARSAVRLVWL